MSDNAEDFARAIHELRRTIEASLKDDHYYLAARKLRELREIAGSSVAALTDDHPAAKKAATARRPSRPVAAASPAPAPEAPPGDLGEALAALRVGVKMEVWDDRYYKAIQIINAMIEAVAAFGVQTPDAVTPPPGGSMAEALRRVRRSAAATLKDNAYYCVARQVQTLAGLLPQKPRTEASATAKAWVHPDKCQPGKPRTFDQLAAASARRVAQLAHPAQLALLARKTAAASWSLGADFNGATMDAGSDLERRASEPCFMGERLR